MDLVEGGRAMQAVIRPAWDGPIYPGKLGTRTARCARATRYRPTEEGAADARAIFPEPLK